MIVTIMKERQNKRPKEEEKNTEERESKGPEKEEKKNMNERENKGREEEKKKMEKKEKQRTRGGEEHGRKGKQRTRGEKKKMEERESKRPEENPQGSLQESTRSIRHEEFTASSLSNLLARHHGCVSKCDRTTARVHGPVFTSHQL